MDINALAKKITLREGKKLSVSIAQVKEVLAATFIELTEIDSVELISTLNHLVEIGRKAGKTAAKKTVAKLKRKKS